jgi:hypothetical protein
MQTKNTHWSSIITLVVIGISLFLLFLLVVALGLGSLMDLFGETGDPASGMIGAVAFSVVTILLITCAWFILQKTRGLPQAELSFKFPFAQWQWIVIPIVVISSIAIGALVTFVELPWLSWIVLPFLTMLVIIPPIWLLFGVASNGIALGPRWRFFTVLGLSMTLGPFIMIVLEIVVLTVIVVAGAVYLTTTQPTLIADIERMSNLINQGMNEEAMVAMLGPYLANPILISVVFGYIALLVPLIEELFKPLAVWLFARQIESPAQGFALGILSGAAFALVESLNASADGTTSWALIVGARTGTSVLHMMVSGLVGWGIVAAFKEKRASRFFASYITAVLIHGIWNASAIGAGLSTIGEAIGRPEWLFNFAPALLCGLVTLGVGVIALLIASNRRLRKQVEVAPLVSESPILKENDEQAKATEYIEKE